MAEQIEEKRERARNLAARVEQFGAVLRRLRKNTPSKEETIGLNLLRDTLEGISKVLKGWQTPRYTVDLKGHGKEQGQVLCP